MLCRKFVRKRLASRCLFSGKHLMSTSPSSVSWSHADSIDIGILWRIQYILSTILVALQAMSYALAWNYLHQCTACSVLFKARSPLIVEHGVCVGEVFSQRNWLIHCFLLVYSYCRQCFTTYCQHWCSKSRYPLMPWLPACDVYMPGCRLVSLCWRPAWGWNYTTALELQLYGHISVQKYMSVPIPSPFIQLPFDILLTQLSRSENVS